MKGGFSGFSAVFSTMCENVELASAFGVLQSPGYPLRVAEERACSWTIRTTPGSRLRLRFHAFELPNVVFGRSIAGSGGGAGALYCSSNYFEVRRAARRRKILLTENLTAAGRPHRT